MVYLALSLQRSFEGKVLNILQEWRKEQSDAKDNKVSREMQFLSSVGSRKKNDQRQPPEVLQAFLSKMSHFVSKQPQTHKTQSATKCLVVGEDTSSKKKLLRMADAAERITLCLLECRRSPSSKLVRAWSITKRAWETITGGGFRI